MLAFAYENLPHVLCALLLLSRIGDIGTTYLVTPNLILEANPIVRKLGWPFALLMAFLLVSASNAGKIWIVRTVGEKAYAALLVDVARRSKLSHALLGIAASSFFVALAGGTVLLFYPSQDEWGFWLGLGVLVYAGAVWFYGTLAMIRLFRRAALPLAGGGVAPPLASAGGGE